MEPGRGEGEVEFVVDPQGVCLCVRVRRGSVILGESVCVGERGGGVRGVVGTPRGAGREALGLCGAHLCFPHRLSRGRGRGRGRWLRSLREVPGTNKIAGVGDG